MKRYIALLRGVNISGKNKISMAQLKQLFEDLDYKEVKTYLNSGNVIFSSDEDDISKITSIIEEMIKNHFLATRCARKPFCFSIVSTVNPAFSAMATEVLTHSLSVFPLSRQNL